MLTKDISRIDVSGEMMEEKIYLAATLPEWLLAGSGTSAKMLPGCPETDPPENPQPL